MEGEYVVNAIQKLHVKLCGKVPKMTGIGSLDYADNPTIWAAQDDANRLKR